MSLDAIRKSILGEAESKVKEEQGEADAEAERIVKEAQARAKEILKRGEDAARREEERMRLEAAAGLETERNTLVIEAKGRVVEQALAQVRREVERRVRADGLERILKSGVKQFAEASGGAEYVVRTSKRNASLVKGKQKVEYGDVDGFILSTPDGKLSLNATVETVVEYGIDGIRRMVADELFSGSAERKIERAASAIGKRGDKAGSGRRGRGAKPSKKARSAPRPRRGRGG